MRTRRTRSSPKNHRSHTTAQLAPPTVEAWPVHSTRRVAALVVLFAACGSNAPSDPLGSSEHPIPDHYEAPPAPCRLVEDSGPSLALPWRGGAQTFLEAGTTRDTIALDYDVWPRPHVERLRVGLDFDRLVSDEVLTFDGACPRTLDLTGLRASIEATAPGDVARIVVIAEDDDRSRRGELFFTTGTRRLRVHVEDALTTDRATLLLFEPAWGEPRVALRVIDAGEGAPWTLDGLPEGPGTLAWIALDDEPLRDPENDVVYLPGGFAQDWIAFASAFRTGQVTSNDDSDSPIALELGTGDFDHAMLTENLAWDGARDLVVVTADASNLVLPMDAPEDTAPDALPHGRVTVPCEPFEVSSLSYAEVHLAIDEAPELAITTTPTTIQPTCTEGSATVSIHTRSRNTRDTRILFHPSPRSDSESLAAE